MFRPVFRNPSDPADPCVPAVLWTLVEPSIYPLPAIPLHAVQPILPLLRLPSLNPRLHALPTFPATYVHCRDHPSDPECAAEHAQLPK